jgi:hypothetical protein
MNKKNSSSFGCKNVEKILSTPIDMGQDLLIWKPHPNGKFSVKSAYMTLLNEEGINSSLTEKQIAYCKKVWNMKDIALKTKLFLLESSD